VVHPSSACLGVSTSPSVSLGIVRRTGLVLVTRGVADGETFVKGLRPQCVDHNIYHIHQLCQCITGRDNRSCKFLSQTPNRSFSGIVAVAWAMGRGDRNLEVRGLLRWRWSNRSILSQASGMKLIQARGDVRCVNGSSLCYRQARPLASS
jgi:hypothetical protein